VRNRGQAQSRDTMRVDESWGRMGWMYCSTGGTIYRGRTPLRPAARGSDGQGRQQH
jgi:hypothetical protein